MQSELKRMSLAVVLSIVVIFTINTLFPSKPGANKKEPAKEIVVKQEEAITPKEKEVIDIATALKEDSRIELKNSAIDGSIRVKGLRFDDIMLAKYKETLDKDSSEVALLQPTKTKNPYYAEFGWLSSDKSLNLPDKDTLWKIKGSDKLTTETPITLEWNNNQGIKFLTKISLDENYMFAIEQSVINNSGHKVELYPYGLISKFKTKDTYSSGVVHEGAIAVIDKTLKEEKFKSLESDKLKEFTSTGGWAGFSDHYWFSAIVFNQKQSNKVKFSYPKADTFQVDYIGEQINIDNDSVGSNQINFYAGAKEIKLIDSYAKNLGIDKFDLSVDFGWYYFLTKPFFYVLDFLYHLIGNMGWAILVFAALLRLAMFPIASKSFESMSKMKKLQPKIQDLKEKYGEDKMKLQQATMEMYKKEKVNPAAGCLPMLIQIPVFFSLYKVLNIAIEIRHAPFIGWIKDLSAPDPLTLSVILHLPIPSLINIGIWPIVMGITMWIQQKLNPAPANKDQARVFAMMPIIFTFMMGHFASGLVIYWTLSNILSIIQQKAIMKKNGVS